VELSAWLTTSQIPAERQLTRHVVFHVHNDYVTQQARHFRIQKRVADKQLPVTIPQRLEWPFLQLFIYTPASGDGIRDVSAKPKAFAIDF